MDLISRFRGVKVLVVGDVMLDRYWWGSVSRISPEAPVPVVRLNETTFAPGGAANVAANVAGLGAYPLLLGCIGRDADAEELRHTISDTGITPDGLFQVSDRKTTVKTRIIAHSQQVARIDQETTQLLNPPDQAEVLRIFLEYLETAAVVAISDYAKGFLSEDLLRSMISAAVDKAVPVVVDPKGRDYSRYHGATIITPNRKEAALACGLDEDFVSVIEIAGPRLLENYSFEAVLVTEGEDGMTLFISGNKPVHLVASAREVYDVTGAGDTVIAAIATSLGSGLDLLQAAKLANAAAGLVVEKVGTAAVTVEGIQAALSEIPFQALQ